MDAGLLDVLHDPADDHVLAVGDHVDVHLGGVLEEAVDQHRPLVGGLHRLGQVAAQVGVVVDHLHGPAAQHVGGAHHDRVADALGHREGLLGAAGHAVLRLAQPELVDQGGEALAVLGPVDGVGGGAEDGHARLARAARPA